MKIAKLLFFFLLPILLVGCINYSEETWLNADGSGKLSMEISTSEQFAALMAGQSNRNPFSQKELEQPFKGVKGIHIKNVKINHQNGDIVSTVTLQFNSLEALNQIRNGNSSPSFLGQIRFSKDKKGRLIFTRTIDKMTLSQGKENNETNSNDDLAGNISGALLSGYHWKYTVHFPSKVISANTSKDNILAQNNTVIWNIPLSDLVKSPQIMTATLKAPLPWLLLSFIVAGLLVILVVLTVTILKSKTKSENL